ncbi:MAG TPA: SLC13 family permease, partial [Tichowtungia sp.]|nr:SLC13 family permease [Tichowtungia sp.]
MHGSDDHGGVLTLKQMIVRMALLLTISIGIGVSGSALGLTGQQSSATAVFLAIILGTLFFWNFRLAIAFLGIGVLMFTKSLDIDHFVKEASLPVILFLVGMMIIVGALRDLGFFTWVVQSILSIPKITGRKFIAVTAVASALLACAVDEVTSIIFISTLVFQVCNRLKLNPTPYIIICVLCTNIGSAGTMMGNPVGIYIGTKAHLTFFDFIQWAAPIMLVSLTSAVFITMWWYRKDLDEFDLRLKERMDRELSLVPNVKVPYGKGLAVLVLTLVAIASHHPLESAFGLDPNSILLVAPLAVAGIIMIVKRDRARHYVEAEVDWWTLLFFMFLFAIAGTLAYTGVTKLMADGFTKTFGTDLKVLIPVVMVTTAIGSAFVDNVIFVAAFAPVIEALGESVKIMPL